MDYCNSREYLEDAACLEGFLSDELMEWARNEDSHMDSLPSSVYQLPEPTPAHEEGPS